MAGPPTKVSKAGKAKKESTAKKREYGHKDVVFLWTCLETLMKQSSTTTVRMPNYNSDPEWLAERRINWQFDIQIDYDAVAKKTNMNKRAAQYLFYKIRDSLSTEANAEDSSNSVPEKKQPPKKGKGKKADKEAEEAEQLSDDSPLIQEAMDEA